MNVSRSYRVSKNGVNKEYSDVKILVRYLCGVIAGGERIIALHGDLGTGKTYLTQRLIKAMGYKKLVSSPTFVIMNKYKVVSKFFKGTVNHIDIYRVSEEEVLKVLDFDEMQADPQILIIMEWEEKLQKYKFANKTDVYIKAEYHS